MHQVRYFLAVSRTLNFTRAADECHVSQPSLTKAIQKLEEELGGLLFRRERGLTHLTDLGRLMLPHLEQTFAAAQAARTLADGFRHAALAPLTLGIADNIFPPDLSAMLAALGDAVPGLTLTLVHDAQHAVIEAGMKGDLDVMLVTQLEDMPDRLRLRPLWREDVRLICPVGHRLAAYESVVLADLRDTDWVARQGCALAAGLLDQMRRQDAGVRVRHHARSDFALQQAVMAGLGCGVSWVGTPYLPGLRVLPVVDAPPRQVALATVAGRAFSRSADAFIRLARARSWDAADVVVPA